ncbi:hypothetical protein HC761_02205, partial [bacterium]|nr:hypothetical protein [bacterium]
ARVITAIPFGLTYWFAVFGPRRQTLHDLIAGTTVVRAHETAAPPAPAIVLAHLVFWLMLFCWLILQFAA